MINWPGVTIDDPSKEKVGYRKPPVSRQFKRGKSGNPNGRPSKTAKCWPTARHAPAHDFLQWAPHGFDAQRRTRKACGWTEEAKVPGA